MTKSYCNPTTPIDQPEIAEPKPEKEIQVFKELIKQAICEEAELSENIVFLTGALRCTINLEDKSKIPGALELCIYLFRDIHQKVEKNIKFLNMFYTEWEGGYNAN